MVFHSQLREGVNKITARLLCLPNVPSSPNNVTRWYSINVTGIVTATETTQTNNTIASVFPPTPSSSVLNSSAQVESESNQPEGLDSDGNEEQDTNDRIGEEIENLKDRILEQVEENLRKEGIELNLR